MPLDAMTTILKKGIPKRGYFLTYLHPEGFTYAFSSRVYTIELHVTWALCGGSGFRFLVCEGRVLDLLGLGLINGLLFQGA